MPVASIPLQRDLFDTRPWKPLKPIKPNPEHLYCLILSMSSRGKKCFASIGWFAKKFEVSARTVSRWISELGKRVTVTRRPGRTSLFCTSAVEKMSGVDVMTPPSRPLLNSSSSSLAGKTAELPRKVQATLQRAERRIGRARNPEAYRRAIVGVECRLLAHSAALERSEGVSGPVRTPEPSPGAQIPSIGPLREHLSGLGIDFEGTLVKKLA